MEEKRQMLHEILDLVMDINGFEKRKRSKTGFKPTAFLNINGHTADVEVAVYDQGWFPFSDRDFSEGAGFHDDSSELKELVEDLTRKKAELDV